MATSNPPPTSIEDLMRGIRHIVRQQERIITLLETRRMGWCRAFLIRIWSAFSEQLSTNIGKWLAGLPLWLLALEVFGFRQLLEKLVGWSG
jgi:hypothetical protein